MATSIIRPSGGGDYLSFAAWAADAARAPGDIAECDEAGTQTAAVVIPALANLTMRATVPGVALDSGSSAVTLALNTGTTGFLCEDIQILHPVVNTQAVSVDTGTGATFRRCLITGQTYGIQSSALVTGALVFDSCQITATGSNGTALQINHAYDLTIDNCVFTAPLACLDGKFAGSIKRTKLRTEKYAWAGGYQGALGVVGDLDILLIDIESRHAAGGGDVCCRIDGNEIPAGKTVRVAHVTLNGKTAYVFNNDIGLYVENPPAGTLLLRDFIISGFAVPYRVQWWDPLQDAFDCWGNLGPPDSPGAGSQGGKYHPGANDISEDPLWIDPAGSDYRLGAGSPCLVWGIDVGETHDLNGVAFGSPPPMGAYAAADSTPPDVTSAAATGSGLVTVTFSEPVMGAALTDAGAWAISTPVAGPTAVTVLSATHPTADTVVLLVSPMDSSALYRATCPASVTDLAGNLINVRDGDFVTGIWASPDSGNPWSATPDGTSADIGTAPFELLDWMGGTATNLARLVWISLFSRRRADDGDDVPDDGGDPVYRGGWAGDSYATGGRRIGSRLWLLLGQPIAADTPARTVAYMDEALAWMQTDGLVSRVECRAERIGQHTIGAGVILYDRAGNQAANLWYDDLWEVYRG